MEATRLILVHHVQAHRSYIDRSSCWPVRSDSTLHSSTDVRMHKDFAEADGTAKLIDCCSAIPKWRCSYEPSRAV
jgi:hypothetical protein